MIFRELKRLSNLTVTIYASLYVPQPMQRTNIGNQPFNVHSHKKNAIRKKIEPASTLIQKKKRIYIRSE